MVQWTSRMFPSSRIKYVKKRLDMLHYFQNLNKYGTCITRRASIFSQRRKTISLESESVKDKFINEYLKLDGIFILRMISMLTSEIIGTELLHHLWAKKSGCNDLCYNSFMFDPNNPNYMHARKTSKKRLNVLFNNKDGEGNDDIDPGGTDNCCLDENSNTYHYQSQNQNDKLFENNQDVNSTQQRLNKMKRRILKNFSMKYNQQFNSHHSSEYLSTPKQLNYATQLSDNTVLDLSQLHQAEKENQTRRLSLVKNPMSITSLTNTNPSTSSKPKRVAFATSISYQPDHQIDDNTFSGIDDVFKDFKLDTS
jgi:hypothetical protein